MFGCIYQLWDWLEAPPLFNGAMDAKKLQALQQQAGAQKKFPLAYQSNINDYRTATHSPAFSQQQQHTAPHQLAGYQLQGFQQSPTATSSSGPLTPIDMQPQPNKALLKHVLGGGNSSSSSHSSPYHQSYTSSGCAAGSSDLYQSPTERTYLAASGRLGNPANALQQQYQQLQQAKLQMQLQTQNEAMQQQQRTFALRQALNPPVPQSQYHMSQSSSIVSTMTLQQQQQQNQSEKHQQQQQQQLQAQQRAPPSSLNLASQFQPAPGPLKVQSKSQQHQHYHQQAAQDQQHIYGHHQQQQQQQQQHQQQQLQMQLQHQQHMQHQQQEQQKLNEQSPIYIQQNHPGHVMNQACQTQISAVKSNSTASQKATPSSEESSIKSPVHAPLDRKKSAGSVQALKSPISKRPPSSPVTLSGWLYKQGSDGLKVWRKRWFVLAEYCLYYYKGPEEEKLLGSILLPSYRVSACLPEDKIYRKYAFKCEHQNMRTYWLAAENAESMVQWVRALSAATMMQATSSGGESDQTSQPSGSSSLNHSGENSDSGIHTLKSQQSKGQVTPASDGAGGIPPNTLNMNPEGTQPLYANAPPKPRRINDGGYSSPSPEHSIDNERKYQIQQQQQLQPQQQLHHVNRRSGIMSPTLQHQQYIQKQQQQQQQQRTGPQPQKHHAIYDTRTGNVSTALHLQQAQQQYSVDNLEADLQQQQQQQKQMALSDDYNKSPPPPTPTAATLGYNNIMDMEEQIIRLQQQQQQQQKQLLSGIDDIYGERELYMQKVMQQRYGNHLGTYPNTERRTPDAYGRSKNRVFSDYEDIYNLAQSGGHHATSAQAALLQEAARYRRPLSPPSYDSNKHMPALSMTYAAPHQETHTTRGRPVTSIMRPHSADFLDFEARAEAAAVAASATAMEAELSGLTNLSSPRLKSDMERVPRPKSSLDINRNADSFYYSEASYADKMRKSALYLQSPPLNPLAQHNLVSAISNNGMHTIGYENPYERSYKRQELLNEMVAGDVQSVPRLSRVSSATNSVHARATSARAPAMAQTSAQAQTQKVEQQSSPGHLQAPALSPSLPTQQIIQQNEQFLRSASARLPKRSEAFEDETNNSNSATSPTIASNTLITNKTNAASVVNTANQQQDGEKKREESMKRLLEWKQRMLQSPLTRKGMQQQQQIGITANNNNNNSKLVGLSKLGSNPNILLSSTTVASGAYYNQVAADLNNSKSTTTTASSNTIPCSIQRSRSETQANASYNSYSSDDEASISVRNVRNLPKGNLTVKPDTSDAGKQLQKQSLTNLYYGSAPDTKYAKTTSLTDNTFLPSTSLHTNAVGGFYNNKHAAGSIYDMHNGYHTLQQQQQQQQKQLQNVPTLRRACSRADINILERETSNQMRKLDVSAGDLLSRTHEELVLLLIQLRRQNSITARAIEQCCSDMHDVQNRLRTADGLTRAESIQRLDYLKQHLLELERQYDKSKPLVNLVDNMVKLGSLYRNNDVGQQRHAAVTLDRMEYNQRMQERHLINDDYNHWEPLSPNQHELQSKVNQLYQLDQLLQEESGTLQHLQRDKENLERALGGLRARIQDGYEMPMGLEAAKKEQQMLESELSHVHQLLIENSKVEQKLEQTVAGNASLEQELLMLRQKLQDSRGAHESQHALNNGWAVEGIETTATLESELKRVQNLVGDMQRQRQELSTAVRQLTENSNRLYHEIGNKDHAVNESFRKRSNSSNWTETDLDSMLSINRHLNDSTISLATPLYVDTNINMIKNNLSNEIHSYNRMNDCNGVDNKSAINFEQNTNGFGNESFLDTNPFANLSNQERQEIKTVRIVKRESERRHRDRSERSSALTNSIQNLDQVVEEDASSAYYTKFNGSLAEEYHVNGRSKSLPRPNTDPPKSRHQEKHRHHHHSNKNNMAMNERYSQIYRNGYTNGTSDKHIDNQMTNVHNDRINLNPLANAYFAKQLQQQMQQGRGSAQTALRQKTDSVQSLNKSITDLSAGPVFQSEAARQIMSEISAGSASEETEKVVEKVPSQYKHRRSVPREKRRHYTAPNNVNIKAMENVQAENDMNRNNTNWRARDDLDMDLALRPRLNAPDVVRSALGQGEKISENTIDNLLLAPNKIVIPERYIPETTPELSAEEKKRRQEKVESIKKMLAEAPISSANDTTVTLPPNKINAEKKQREHLLQLNQILAQQVMQMSKIVAEKAMARVNDEKTASNDEQMERTPSVSPNDPLPILQQRDNFFK